MGGAPAPDGGGGSPIADRLAIFGPGAARSLGGALGARDPGAHWRDRRRRRLARPGDPRLHAGARWRGGGDRGELRFVADPTRIYRPRAAIPARGRALEGA